MPAPTALLWKAAARTTASVRRFFASGKIAPPFEPVLNCIVGLASGFANRPALRGLHLPVFGSAGFVEVVELAFQVDFVVGDDAFQRGDAVA